MDVQINLRKEECALDMGQRRRRNDTVVMGAQIKSSASVKDAQITLRGEELQKAWGKAETMQR